LIPRAARDDRGLDLYSDIGGRRRRALGLPARYEVDSRVAFRDRAAPFLRPGVRILDVGAGAHPALAPEHRPPRCVYVGLDFSGEELERAPEGSYARAVVGDVGERLPELERAFDLALSWQVLEHVGDVRSALENVRGYLEPGGAFVFQLSGRYSLPALAQSLVPAPLRPRLAERLQGRRPEDVFPARYDLCTHSELSAALSTWSAAEITPRFLGAAYLRAVPRLQRLFASVEDRLSASGRLDLATYYLVRATS
jgi:SAM-dependent methyltransferase